MGMKPRKRIKTPSVTLSKNIEDLLSSYVGAVREYLINFEVPKEQWDLVWSHDLEDDYPSLYEDNDHLAFCMGWIRGIADYLGVSETDLAKL